MQMGHTNQHYRPLVTLHSQSNTDKYKYITGRIPRIFQPTVVYLLNIPFVGLSVDILRLIWRIFAFIVSVFSGKIVRRRVAQTSVVAIEPKAQSYITEPEVRLKEHFLVMASHELKTPMTTILGQAQLMLRRLSRMPELTSELAAMRTALESIDSQTRRLNTLVDDLLDLYNVHAGKIELRLTACNLVELCREVVNDQSLLSGRTIELEAPLTSIILQADRDRLSQVVVNLVNNAIKYSPNDCPVKVLVDQRHDIGIIEVYDSGPGIPRDEQARIFEPFYRGTNIQAPSKSGLGLGLAICKEIVDRHSGRIWYRARTGRGSIFIVELPLKRKVIQRMH